MSPCTKLIKALFDPSQLHKYTPSSQVTDIVFTKETKNLKEMFHSICDTQVTSSVLIFEINLSFLSW